MENKAQDSAYDGKVIVTYPSIIDYSGSNQVGQSFKSSIYRAQEEREYEYFEKHFNMELMNFLNKFLT